MRRLAKITAGVLLLLSELAMAQDLTLGGYSFVGFTRISRVAYDITFSANITNSATDVQNVIATLTSSSPHLSRLISASSLPGGNGTGSNPNATSTASISKSNSDPATALGLGVDADQQFTPHDRYRW